MSTANDNILFQSDTTKKYDIPLTHLDYNYIGKCSDVKELEKIYRVLKSGDEGCYPDLERYCEQKIESLNPKSRVLRREAPLGRPGDLPKDEWEQIDVDLQNWELEMQSTESTKKKLVDEFDDPELPPIRSGFINGHSQQNAGTEDTEKSTKRVMPRSYKEWDKFDIDKELENADIKEEDKKEIFKSSKVPDIETNISTAGMTDEEKMIKAGKEKDKGNEAFRAGDYEESIAYYTRSIKLLSTAASYNNRAIAYLKTSQWTQAAEDCNRVLKIEPENIKALLRRGTAYKGMKEFKKSLVDFQKALQLEPDNKRAKDLIQELHIEEKKLEVEKKKRKEKGRRMVIEEVEDESDDEIVVDKKPEESKPSFKEHSESGKKMKIVEIDEDPPSSGGKNSVGQCESASKIQKENVSNEKKVKIENEKSEVKKTLKHKDNYVKTDSKISNDKNIWTEDDVKDVQNESENRKEFSKNTNQGSNIKNENRSGKSSGTEISDNSPVKTESKTEQTEKEEKMTEKTENVANEQNGMVNSSLERPKFVQGPLSSDVAALREAGNNLFRTGQFGEAIQKYTQAVQKMEKDTGDVRVNQSLLYSNRAACYLKTGDCPHAIKDCTTALELVPHSIKPLLRRANAYEVLERYRLAYADYKHVLSIDSSVDIALQGSSRCQKHLIDVDGSKWREKLPRVPSVQLWDIPEIVDSSGSPINATTPSQPVNSPVTSTSQPVSGSVSSPTPSQVTSSSKPEKSPEEKFDELKSEGNSFVQKGSFSQAVQCYTQCVELLPNKTVSYTNRSLCYLKLNQASEAEEDCTKALSLEKDNVKALFRRAQARKMLKKHKDSLEDLNHLLKVDSKNTAAKKEMEIVKGLWREELNNMKKEMDKPRKRIVIQETDSEDEEETTQVKRSSTPSNSKSALKQSETPNKTTDTKQDTSKDTKTGTKQSNKTDIKKQSSQNMAKDSKSEQKQNKKSSTTKQTTPVTLKESKSESEVKKTDSSKTDSEKIKEKQKEQKSKSSIKPTSFGLPQSVPKLEKATPYEFITAWNSLKQSTDLQPYADLLKQIPPEEIPKVISNKLDGGMLSKIAKCVAEKFVGQEEHGYKILQNISKVPRFDTIAMFMSKEEKKDVDKVLSGVQTSGLANKEDITNLRKKYSL